MGLPASAVDREIFFLIFFFTADSQHFSRRSMDILPSLLYRLPL